MKMYGKEIIFGQILDGEQIDAQSRIDALMGDKKDVQDLDIKAKEIQRAKERRAHEEKRAKERAERQRAKATAEGIDILCDVVTVAAKNKTVRKCAKITAKAAVTAGAVWLIYRGVKFITDKM